MSFMVRLVNSPEMVAMVTQAGEIIPPQPQTVEAARLALTSKSEHLEKTGSGKYIVSIRRPNLSFTDEIRNGEEREYIGTVSMQLKRFPNLPCPAIPDVGFALLGQYYGNGYANEACNALIRYFQEEKGHERFAGFTHPENVGSQRLFKRLGFENRGVTNVSGILGTGEVGVRVAVWVKGVDPETKLSDLGIGPRSPDHQTETV